MKKTCIGTNDNDKISSGKLRRNKFFTIVDKKESVREKLEMILYQMERNIKKP